MKDLQTGFLKILGTLFFTFLSLISYPQNVKIKKADSLFQAKQFTQSLEIYESMLKEKHYSANMLLKMAFINEGLGKIGETLYCLKLYHLASSDDQALKKMEELAAKFNLNGYSLSANNPVENWIRKNLLLIQLFLGGIAAGILVVNVIVRKKIKASFVPLVFSSLVLALLFYITNYYTSSYVTVVNPNTILMSGPSAGAKVSSKVGEGNLLKSLGRIDVWEKVEWMNQTVYVKSNQVRAVML